MPEGPAIAIEALSKRFADGPWVIRDMSFSAGGGEIISIVGPSGCGKSTLLRLIAGLIPATSGRIIHPREPINPAFIFQDATLLPWATVQENIALPARLKGSSRNKRMQSAEEWAQMVGLHNVLGYYPRQLSGGMKMRVSIARALSQAPNLLLLDEPFGALDAITRNKLNEDLLKLHEENKWTAFFVTHSVTEAVFLANRIIIMGNNPGIVEAVVENRLAYPRNASTRESIEYQQCVAEATSRLHHVLSS